MTEDQRRDLDEALAYWRFAKAILLLVGGWLLAEALFCVGLAAIWTFLGFGAADLVGYSHGLDGGRTLVLLALGAFVSRVVYPAGALR